jgi:hypothetical protein
MRRSMRQSATFSAVALATLGLAGTAGASIQQLPPGAQVNDDPAAGIDPARDAGVSDVVGGSLAAGGVRVPWAAFEQQTPGEQQIFVRAFKGGAWKTQGASLNIDRNVEAEAPSIDFAGTGRTVPWTAWYEPNKFLGDGKTTNIFASRFAAAQNTWIPEGQDRAPNHKIPSLNIHVDHEAENPAVAGGAVTPGNDPVPWVAWQEKDGADTNQIFVSRGIKQTDCSANQPGGGTSVSAFCWQQVGLGRIAKDTLSPGPDPTLNVDPSRNGIEPDIAFTGTSDTVPWVVWAEDTPSGKKGIFVSRLVNGNHFELANGGKPLSNPNVDADDPDITFSGNTPYVTWHAGDTVTTGHFASLTKFKVDARAPEPASGRSPISSSNTSDPFTADGANPQGGAAGTPFFLTLTDPAPHKLLAHAYKPDRVRTYPATHVRKTSAQLNGSLDPAGAPVKVHFEYGPTKAYGNVTPDQRIAPANRYVGFDEHLTGLPKKTIVHYRSVAVSDFGTFVGHDQVFKTGRHEGIKQRRLWMTPAGNVIVRLSCPADNGGRCKGVVTLSAKHRLLGSAHYSIRARHAKKVVVHLKPKAQRLVRHSHKLKVRVATGSAHRTLVMRWTR